MRILQFLPYLPYPPSNGGRVRSLNILEHLAKKHSIDLVCYVKPGEDVYLAKLARLCNHVYPIPRLGSPSIKRVRRLSFSLKPILVNFFTSEKAQAILRNLLIENSYDVIHIETNYIAHNLFVLLKGSYPVVLVESNIESDLMQQLASHTNNVFWKFFWMFDAIKQRVWERKVWQQATRCAAVAINDANVITRIKGSNKVDLVENGVNIDLVPVGYPALIKKRILFVGNFSHKPNVDGILFFLRYIFPIIKEKIGDVVVDIVGENPPGEILSMPNLKDINTFGYVDDLRPFYERAMLSICPIRIASGSRIKILEALAYGHPVVSTRIGCSGLDVVDREHILIADSPSDFAQAICLLIESRELRRQIGRKGRRQVQEKYDWKKSADALLDCYLKAKDEIKKPLIVP